MKKKLFVVATGALSLALVANGAYTVYADGEDITPPPGDTVTPPEVNPPEQPEEPEQPEQPEQPEFQSSY